MELRQVIFEMRQELGLSQEGLARPLGISQKTVARWEHGDFDPDLLLLFRVLDFATGDWKLRLMPFLPAEAIKFGEFYRRQIAPQTKRRRYDERKLLALHRMVDLITENGTSGHVAKLESELRRIARTVKKDLDGKAEWEEEQGFEPPPTKKPTGK